MSLRRYHILLVLGVLGLVLQLVDAWPILATMRLATLIFTALVHIAAGGSVLSIILKARRKESVLLTDVLQVAFAMLLTWTADFTLLAASGN